MKQLAILDVELAKLTSNYPQTGPGVFAKVLQFIYTLYNTVPQASDFHSRKTADDGKVSDVAGISAPIIVMGASRDETEAAAIARFIKEELRLFPESESVVIPPTYGSTPYVHFLTNEHFSRKRFAELRQRYHGARDVLRVADFMVLAPSTSQWEELAICPDHSVEDFSYLNTEAKQREYLKAVHCHITECLGKKVDGGSGGAIGSGALPPEPAAWQGATAYATRWSVDCQRAGLSNEEWRLGHPYFRAQSYTQNNLILLTKDEVKQLTKDQKKWYKLMEDGELTVDDEKRFKASLEVSLVRLYQRHLRLGYNMLPFAACKDWTLTECVKFAVKPPTPRPRLALDAPAPVGTLHYTQDQIDTLFVFLSFTKLILFVAPPRAKSSTTTNGKTPATNHKSKKKPLSAGSDISSVFTVQLSCKEIHDYLMRLDPTISVTSDRTTAFITGDGYKRLLASVAQQHPVPVEVVLASVETVEQPLEAATRWATEAATAQLSELRV